MRFIYNLGVYFYLTALTFIGLFMIALAANLIQAQDITPILEIIYTNVYNSRIILSIGGGLLIVLAFSFAQILTGKIQGEKTIPFNNPAGQVTVSLSAVEDLIKRLASQVMEIKESRSSVRAVKKGLLEVYLRITLRSETNIPDLTSNLQDMIKRKLHEILPIEKEILVNIHVAKIISRENKEDDNKEDREFKSPTIPFQGYGQ